MTPEEMVSRLLYRDALMLVIDKPAGFAVHRGPKGGASLEDYFDALRFGLPRPPALAHRLDRDTSGCLVLGRHRKALARLGRLFKSGSIRKTYWAVVEGAPEADEGLVALPLGRRDATRGWWMKHDPQNGQPAVTKWRVLGHCSAAPGDCPAAHGPGIAPSAARVDAKPRLAIPLSSKVSSKAGATMSWLALEPLTGRTHQLRVHCAEMGWPIMGDAIYGTASRAGGGLSLLAREIVVPLYKNRPPVRVVAPVPQHMQKPLSACGWPGEITAASCDDAVAAPARGQATRTP